MLVHFLRLIIYPNLILFLSIEEEEKSEPQKVDEKIEMLLWEENSEDEEDLFNVARDR